MKKKLFKVGIPIAILTLGGIAAASLTRLSPTAERSAPPLKRTSVEVTTTAAQTLQAKVSASGLVTPARQISVLPEVTGRILQQSPQLVPGGRFRQGEVIARINSQDYRLALTQEQSRVQQRQVELEQERGRREIAAREWQLLGGGDKDTDSSLALREPQLAAAKVGLEAAQSGLERARVNLARTVIRAPFNAMVLSEQVDVGQVVGPGTPIATLIGTDELWVRVSVPVEKLEVIEIPGVTSKRGSSVEVVQALRTGNNIVRRGAVLRLEGELDPQTRTAQLLIEIDAESEQPGSGLPLLPGANVEVVIEGRSIEQAITIPRVALRDGTRVWLVDDDGELAERAVTVGWRERDSVVVTAGLEPGERVVTSPIATPIVGMLVEPMNVGTREVRDEER